MIKIVASGGGHGLANVLVGLRKGLGELRDQKKLMFQVTGLVGNWDEGGRTRTMVDEYSASPYLGDLTRCVAAISTKKEIATALTRPFKGGPHDGWEVRHLLLKTLEDVFPENLDEALEVMHLMCFADHDFRVMSVTRSSTVLICETRNGSKIRGEKAIDSLGENPLHVPLVHSVKKVTLDPPVFPAQAAFTAIRECDLFIFAPGSFPANLGTISPVGLSDAFRKSSCRVAIMINIMTQADNRNFRVMDFVRIIEEVIQRRCDFIIRSNTPIPPEVVAHYGEEREIQIDPDMPEDRMAQLISADLSKVRKESLEIYHSSTKLAPLFRKLVKRVLPLRLVAGDR